MIRIFSFLYKTDLRKLPDTMTLFKILQKKFQPESQRCPKCKAGGFLCRHGSYDRNLVAYEDKQVVGNTVDIDRFYCGSCHATSAVLPDILVPHKTYSLLFILAVLQASLLNHWTIEHLCDHFGISAATYYAWKTRYLSHKTLDFGVLEKYIAGNDSHLQEPKSILICDLLLSFFKRFGFSFLEYSKTTEIHSP